MLNWARCFLRWTKYWFMGFMLTSCLKKGALWEYFSSRPFKQRPTNSSQPSCFGRKTRRSHSVKFESVVLESKKVGGRPAAVGGVAWRCCWEFRVDTLAFFYFYFFKLTLHFSTCSFQVCNSENWTGGSQLGKSWTVFTVRAVWWRHL